jgi:hypothetical protein
MNHCGHYFDGQPTMSKFIHYDISVVVPESYPAVNGIGFIQPQLSHPKEKADVTIVAGPEFGITSME